MTYPMAPSNTPPPLHPKAKKCLKKLKTHEQQCSKCINLQSCKQWGGLPYVCYASSVFQITCVWLQVTGIMCTLLAKPEEL